MKYAILLSIVLIAGACGSKYEKTHPVVENISESVYASGTVKSKGQYQVYSTVSGTIREIFVTEGDVVREGDPLIRVQNSVTELSTENARIAAEHADIRHNLDKLREARVSIDLAFTRMKNDSLLLVRQRNLNAQNVGTRVELEQRELAYRSSLAAYQLAVMTYKDLKRDLAFSSDQSKTNLEISKALAGDYVIRARANGRVYKIFKEAGELANTVSPLAVIGDANAFYVELNVDEYDISRVQQGQQIFFRMDSHKDSVYEGRVEKIEPLMSEESRSFTVDAALLTRPKDLFANLSLEANIVIRSKQKVLTIPRSYLIGDSVVMTSRKEKRKVKIGIRDFRKAEVISGLTEEDVIYRTTP